MTDRLEELEGFLAILDTGGFTAAARRLGRSGPALTRGLQALEARLGARLLERTTRSVHPTEAGLRLAAEAREVLAHYRAALSGKEDQPEGLLRITAPVIFGGRHIAPLLAGFLARHPGIRAELTLSDRNLDMIEDGQDVALRIGQVTQASLHTRRVGEVRRVLVASPAYLAAHGEPLTPAELGGHSLIFTASRPVPREWRFRQRGREVVHRFTPRLTVTHVEAGLAIAAAGHGIATALSYQVLEDIARGRFTRLLRDFEPPAMPVQLVWPRGQHLPRRVALFLEETEAELKELPLIR
jgi:DNA-binding transcriptional LysR family regulator